MSLAFFRLGCAIFYIYLLEAELSLNGDYWPKGDEISDKSMPPPKVDYLNP